MHIQMHKYVLYTHGVHNTDRPPNHAPSGQKESTYCPSVGWVHGLEEKKREKKSD